MSDLCVTLHDGDRRALPGLRLCGSCRDGLERDLHALPRLHAQLGDALATGGTASGSGRVTGSSSAPLPINPAVADWRDQIRHDLVWWCLFVADARGLAQPENRVGEIAAWLGRHVEWIAGHDAAAQECPSVMRALVGRARALLNPSGAKRITIGACHDSTEDGPCRGTIWATCRAEDDPRPSEIYCDGPCGMRKGAEEWRRWGHEYLRTAG